MTLWRVLGVDAIKRMKEIRRAKAKAEYTYNHAACPSCGNIWTVEQTCGPPLCGYEIGHPEYHDTNYAKCPCGWRGKVHDLLPEKPIQAGDTMYGHPITGELITARMARPFLDAGEKLTKGEVLKNDDTHPNLHP